MTEHRTEEFVHRVTLGTTTIDIVYRITAVAGACTARRAGGVGVAGAAGMAIASGRLSTTGSAITAWGHVDAQPVEIVISGRRLPVSSPASR